MSHVIDKVEIFLRRTKIYYFSALSKLVLIELILILIEN